MIMKRKTWNAAKAAPMREPRPRRVRVKSPEQLEYEKMLADWKINGAAHLASALKKMGK